MGIVPMPINAAQCSELTKMLEKPPSGEEEYLLDLITNRVPPGVDEAAYVKADFLTAIVKGKTKSPLIDAAHAVKLASVVRKNSLRRRPPPLPSPPLSSRHPLLHLLRKVTLR